MLKPGDALEVWLPSLHCKELTGFGEQPAARLVSQGLLQGHS